MGKVRKQRKKLHVGVPKAPNAAFDSNTLKIDASHKSLKSEFGIIRPMSKKNKQKLRHKMLKQKLVGGRKVDEKPQRRNRCRDTSIVDNVSPLLAGLPSLKDVVKFRKNINCLSSQPKKVKGIEKTAKLKKSHLQSIDMYKSILRNKEFQKNPLVAISDHVKAVVEGEKSHLQK